MTRTYVGGNQPHRVKYAKAQGEAVSPAPTGPDLTLLTITELKKLAEKLKVDLAGATTKTEIIKAIGGR